MTTPDRESLSVVLTGASEGIGREIARILAARGHQLVLAARNQERLESIARECQELGATAIAVTTDVTDQQQCQALIQTAHNKFKKIDVLINNAGITMWSLFEEVEDMSIFENIMRVNYLSAVYLTHAALPHLKTSQGRIVAVSSLAGLTGVPTRSGYAASKHAMFGFFESLRIELLKSGVSVTLIAPDFVTSQIHKRALTADGSELNKRPLKDHKIMTAQQCAQHTVNAMMARKRIKVMSMRGYGLRWLRLLVPRLVDKLASKLIVQKP